VLQAATAQLELEGSDVAGRESDSHPSGDASGGVARLRKTISRQESQGRSSRLRVAAEEEQP